MLGALALQQHTVEVIEVQGRLSPEHALVAVQPLRSIDTLHFMVRRLVGRRTIWPEPIGFAYIVQKSDLSFEKESLAGNFWRIMR